MWYISVSGDSIRTLSQWVCLQCSHIRVSVSSALDVYTGQGCGLLSRVINHAVSCMFPSKHPANISPLPGCICLGRRFK